MALARVGTRLVAGREQPLHLVLGVDRQCRVAAPCGIGRVGVAVAVVAGGFLELVDAVLVENAFAQQEHLGARHRIAGRIPLRRFARAALPPQLIAFSSSSYSVAFRPEMRWIRDQPGSA